MTLGVRVENPADVPTGLKRAFQHSGPALIDVVTDPNAVSLPSHITAEQVEGFALTMRQIGSFRHIDEVINTIETNIIYFVFSCSVSNPTCIVNPRLDVDGRKLSHAAAGTR